MRNRGNGKGGGIAACGLVPEDFGVSRNVLEEDYLLQVALLDPNAKEEVEKEFIEPYFTIDQGGIIPTVDDYRDVPLLQVKPPDVARYFVRVKSGVAGQICKREKPDRSCTARNRRRVRLPELKPAEQQILRLAGRKTRLCAFARPQPYYSQGRGICRSGRAVLLHGGFARACVDRAPALPDAAAGYGIRAAAIRSSA